MNKFRKKLNEIPLTVKVSTSYAICSILQKCLSFITLPLFTRLLTTEQYGQYTIYTSWSGILMIFLTLNLAYGSFSTAMVKYETRRNEYISAIQGICLLFLLIYLPFRNIWNQLFEIPTIYVLLMISEIIFSTATTLWMGKNRFEYKYKSVVAVTLLTAIISPVLAYILVCAVDQKGYARIVGYAGINILVGIIIFVMNIKRGKHLYNKEFWRYAFGFNVPLLAYYLSQVIFNQSDRIMISHITGTSDAAMYGVAYNLATILTFILNAINGSYVPWLYGKIKDHKAEENKTISLILTVLMGLMILCVIWYAPEIIIVMAGKNYEAAIYVVAPVAMSLLLLFYCQLFINVEFYYEKTKFVMVASCSGALLNIVLNYIYIRQYGYYAAGYTTLVCYIVFSVAHYFAYRKIVSNEPELESIYDIRFVILLSCGVLIMMGLMLVGYSNSWLRYIVLVGIVLILLGNRNKIIRKIIELRKK